VLTKVNITTVCCHRAGTAQGRPGQANRNERQKHAQQVQQARAAKQGGKKTTSRAHRPLTGLRRAEAAADQSRKKKSKESAPPEKGLLQPLTVVSKPIVVRGVRGLSCVHLALMACV